MPDSHCAMLQAIQHTLLVQPAVSATYPDHAVVRNGVHLVMEAVKRKVAIAAVAVVLLAGGSFIAVSTWNSSMANTLSGSVQMPAAWRGDPAFNAIDKAYAIAAEPANVGDMGCVAGYAAPGCVVQVEGGNTLESSLATDISKHLFQSLPRELDTVKVSESVESMNHSPGGDVVAVVRCKIEGVTCMDEVLYGAQRVKRGTRITLDPTFQDVWQQRSGQWLNTKRTWLAPSNKALSLYPLEDAPGAYRPRP